MRSIVPARLALLLLFVLAGIVSACAWVSPEPGAESVRISASFDAVRGCEKLGTVHAQTRAKVDFITRSSRKVSQELATLARNHAVGMAADTLVAEGPPSIEGHQSFAAYRCH
jgi:hypothetical protein